MRIVKSLGSFMALVAVITIGILGGIAFPKEAVAQYSYIQTRFSEWLEHPPSGTIHVNSLMIGNDLPTVINLVTNNSTVRIYGPAYPSGQPACGDYCPPSGPPYNPNPQPPYNPPPPYNPNPGNGASPTFQIRSGAWPSCTYGAMSVTDILISIPEPTLRTTRDNGGECNVYLAFDDWFRYSMPTGEIYINGIRMPNGYTIRNARGSHIRAIFPAGNMINEVSLMKPYW